MDQAKYMAAGESEVGASLSGDEIDFFCIKGVRNGHKNGFDLIVRRHQPQIHRFLLRHTKRSDDAIDLTQEVFMQAYLKLGAWRGEGKFSSWLVGIALNIARNHANRNPHLRMSDGHLDEFGDNVSVRCEDNPELLFGNRARHEALLLALEQLPAELREPLMLVAVDGVPYVDVAQSLGVPLGTLKSRLNRGRRFLRQALISHF